MFFHVKYIYMLIESENHLNYGETFNLLRFIFVSNQKLLKRVEATSDDIVIVMADIVRKPSALTMLLARITNKYHQHH